jgi:hypothetical protein
MKYDIAETLAELVRKANSNFDRELEEQEKTLRCRECINPYYGEWLDMGVALLFSIFELEDHDFARQLPELAHLSRTARRQFLKHIEAHLYECEHCALKQQYELSLNEKIEEACSDNRELLIQQLEEELRTSDSHIDKPPRSYFCASNSAGETSGARPPRFQYRQNPRRDGH